MSIRKLVENLSDEYEFFIICGDRDYGDTEAIPGIITGEWTDWNGKAKVFRIPSDQQDRKTVFGLLDSIEADIYYIQGIFSLYFSIFPLIWWHQAKQDKVIIAPRGMLHTTALSVKKTKKKIYLMAANIMGWFHYVHFHSTNKEETAEMKGALGKNIVCFEASNFPNVLPFRKTDPGRVKGELKLLNIARISPEKNTRFLIDCLAEVKSTVSLTMVGNYNDESYYKSVMKRVEKLPANIKVDYVGFKKLHELAPLYESHDVLILPTLGENFGHAISEALYSGLPCLISHNTPWTDLEKSGAGFNLDLNTADFARKIDWLNELDENVFAEMCKSASAYIHERNNIEKLKVQYRQMLS